MTAMRAPANDRQAEQLFLGALTLAGAALLMALVFQYGLGYQPCKLCFLQRWPYYVGLPLAALALAAGGPGKGAGRLLIGLFALVFIVSIGLGAYHAGVEWKFWAGPTDCSAPLTQGPASVLDLRKSLQNAKVIRCDEAALRVLGLSFPGWNALVSLVVVALATLSLTRRSGAVAAQP